MSIRGIKHWKDWLHPIATVVGAWGGFPKPPEIFLELTKYELFRWFLVFVLAYQGGADEDLRQALIITVVFYLTTKLLNLREIVGNNQHAPNMIYPTSVDSLPVKDQHEAQAQIQSSTQVTTNEETAPATEQFFGGYYL